MRRHSELTAYQLTLPDKYGNLEFVPRFSSGRPDTPYLPLSQSRLELLAGALAHPQEPIPDPAETVLPVHLAVTRGTIIHRIAQLTAIWRAVQPTQTGDYQAIYRHNLVKHLPRLVPTAKRTELNRLIAILDDPRLALPKTGGWEVSANARKTIYGIIAEKTLTAAKERPPFTGNQPLFDADESLAFPRPEVFAAAWENTKIDSEISALTAALFGHDESLTVLPSDYSRNTRQFGAASELRISGLDHPDAVVWSARLDVVARVPEYQGKTLVQITDFKTGREKQPETVIEDDAIRAAAFMTAQLAVHLPDKLPPAGIAVRVKLQPGPIPANVEINITHLVLMPETGQTQIIDLLAEIGEDWHSPKQARAAAERVSDLAGTIRQNAKKLAPILRR